MFDREKQTFFVFLPGSVRAMQAVSAQAYHFLTKEHPEPGAAIELARLGYVRSSMTFEDILK